MYRTISERIFWSHTVLDTALSTPAIHQTLATWNLDREQLLAGKTLVHQAQMLNAAQQKERGDRYHATDALHAAREEARSLYHKHLADARHALRNQRGHWQALALHGERKADLFGWLAQAETFYANAGLVMPILKKYNVTDAEITKAKALIGKVMEAYGTRSQEASQAKMATQQRNVALQALDAWMKRFVLTAKLAFADEPHYLNLLGITRKTVA